MSKGPYRLILASAGTGKTWQLTTRYLELLLGGATPESILATTFTRKAAGEILDRVLRRLADLAESEEERAEFAKLLERPLPRAEAVELLAGLTRSLHRFRVRTLDAFFVHLAKLFALDLGLPPDWSIVEEAEDTGLRRNAVGAALAKADPRELLALLRGLQQADSSRSIEYVLLNKVRAGRDAFLDAAPGAWNRVQAPPAPDEGELEEALRYLEAFELPRTKTGTPRTKWTSAREKLLACVRREAWKDLFELTIVKRTSDEEPKFDSTELGPDLIDAIQTLLRQGGHELIADVVKENAATFDWLTRFETAYEDEKRVERAYRFEDLPKALHPKEENRIANQDLVWYRIDGRIDHILLDEFQDTSPVQWRILRNLVDEVLADGTNERSFFCVGDVKQSIYGWREAEPRLLAGMKARYPQLEVEELARSYRSAPVVLETIDHVFAHVDVNAALKSEEERAAAAAFAGDYPPHEANDKSMPGAAWLIESPAEDDQEDEVTKRIRLAAERVRAILEQAPAATVGVLLRRNALIPRLIYELRKLQVHASGEGGNALTDSSAVLHLLSLLLLADHPGDTAAAFHVAFSPLGAAVGLTRAGWREERFNVAADVRDDLAADGYGRFCDGLAATVGEHYGAWDRTRFGQLVDLAHAFEDRANQRPGLFVQHVRETRVEDPSATQIQVMTVHAAKGLEFDAVVLPELDQALAGNPTLLTHRPADDPGGLLQVVSHTRPREVCKLDTSPGGLRDLRAEQRQREVRESLCLLYVAMTRARYRLDMIVPPLKKGLHRDFAGLLRDALAGARPPDEHGVLWASPKNSEPWCPDVLTQRSTPTPMERVELALAPPAGRLPIPRTPSATEGGGAQRARDLLRSSRTGARLRGTLIHRWFAEIEWLDDFTRDDEALLILGGELTPDEALLHEALAEFTAALDRDAVRTRLLRPGGADVPEVWRERAFSLTLPGAAGDEHWSGTFDRVVVQRRAGQPVAAQLLDFKTDDVAGDELVDRARFYAPQLESYRRVLAHMTGLPEAAIDAGLLFVREGTFQAL